MHSVVSMVLKIMLVTWTVVTAMSRGSYNSKSEIPWILFSGCPYLIVLLLICMLSSLAFAKLFMCMCVVIVCVCVCV